MKHEPLTKLHELRYIMMVSNLNAQKEFYEDIFNWPVIDDWGGGILYDTGAATIELIQSKEVHSPNGSTRIAIAVAHVHELFENIKDKVDLEFPLRDNSWGDTSFRFKDPEGFQITVFTPHKKS